MPTDFCLRPLYDRVSSSILQDLFPLANPNARSQWSFPSGSWLSSLVEDGGLKYAVGMSNQQLRIHLQSKKRKQ